MDDGTPVTGFSQPFYESEIARSVSNDANNLLAEMTRKAQLSLKTPYDDKPNATAMDTLGEFFGVFNDEINKGDPDTYEPKLRDDELSINQLGDQAKELSMPFKGKGKGYVDISSQFIKDKEKFDPKAYPDKTWKDGKLITAQYVAGFGSTTTTKPDGTVVRVNKNTVVTLEDSLRDLNRRINKEFVPLIQRTIGKDSWNSFNDRQKAAIISITYNYGRVPKRIREALKSGDIKAGANAIRKLAGDNKNINKKRRLQEADMFEGIVSSSLMSRSK
jgi:GH24 family phage-related lysozyme (muramidase)